MPTYRIEMTTESNYYRLMNGGAPLGVPCQNFDIEAESPEEALHIAKAEHPDLIANEYYVNTLEELAEAERKHNEWVESERAKEERRKAKKAENEARKASEMGMTIPEYKKYKRHKAWVKNQLQRLRELDAERAEILKALNKN